MRCPIVERRSPYWDWALSISWAKLWLPRLKEEKGMDATLVNPRYITGVDEALLDDLKLDHTLVITLEDGVLDGGFGEKIARYYGPSDMKVLNYGVKKEFIDRYDVEEQLKKNRLTVPQIVEDICRIC